MLKVFGIMKPRTTSGLDGENLVEVENANAHRMRSLKFLIESLESVMESNEVTHAYKHFPPIIASFDDGKDEAEMKELMSDLEMLEDDLKENETKVAKAKAAQNSKKEKFELAKRPDIVKSIERVKLKLAAVTDRKNRKQRTSPTRKRSHGFDEVGESPEKRMRITSKKFPSNSPVDVRHSLKEYFKETDEELMFIRGKDGFEQDSGEWNDDAQRKLDFLHEEVTA